MATKKNTFKKDNPALSFISTPDPDEAEVVEIQGSPEGNSTIKIRSVSKRTAPEGYKVNPEYIEVKSKRVQLLLQPSVVDSIKALAKKKGLSMNEAINEAIHEYLHNEWID